MQGSRRHAGKPIFDIIEINVNVIICSLLLMSWAMQLACVYAQDVLVEGITWCEDMPPMLTLTDGLNRDVVSLACDDQMFLYLT